MTREEWNAELDRIERMGKKFRWLCKQRNLSLEETDREVNALMVLERALKRAKARKEIAQ